MSLESKQKVSLSKKGTPAWNKGVEMPSVAEKMKGNTNGTGNKGRKMSKEWLKKLSLAKLGKPSPRKGVILTEEQREKIRLAKIGIPKTLEENLKNREGQIKRYLKINPDYKVATRNRRIIDNGGFHSNKEWGEMKLKYDFICPRCKKSEPEIKLTRDHIIPLLLGGKNDITNIQPLCKQCNCEKHTQTIKY